MFPPLAEKFSFIPTIATTIVDHHKKLDIPEITCYYKQKIIGGLHEKHCKKRGLCKLNSCSTDDIPD